MTRAFDRLVVLDFEATCERGEVPSPQEIIELPSVLVSLSEGRVISEFESFVRPVHHPILSRFCVELTGIQQAEVDAAAPFDEVFARHRAWLEAHGLVRDDAGDSASPEFAFVTCGNWDLRSMLPRQCVASGIRHEELPACYHQWINLKVIYEVALGVKRPGGMVDMLQALGLTLEGRHHRGIDDCRNLARIVLALAERGATFGITGGTGLRRSS